MVSRLGVASKNATGPAQSPVRTARPILAVTSNGKIAKANLQARRAFGEVAEVALEGNQLGAAIAGIMFGASSGSERIALTLLTSSSERQEVLLVPSLAEETATITPTVESEREYSVRIAAAPTGRVEAVASVAQVNDFIAHELRNHLTTMLGLSNLVENNFETIPADERTACMRRIQLEAEDGLLVLEGLLKLVETKHAPERGGADVPLHSVIHRVVRAHRRRYSDRAVIVSGDAPLFALGNSNWIQIALTNLMNNAEKVTPVNQPIEIKVRDEADRATVLVLDMGQALAQPMYQELWDIYAKGPPGGLQISGTGIGLSLCKELVTSMGGRVWAGPRRDMGSAFAISLRVARRPVEPDPGQAREKPVVAAAATVPAAA